MLSLKGCYSWWILNFPSLRDGMPEETIFEAFATNVNKNLRKQVEQRNDLIIPNVERSEIINVASRIIDETEGDRIMDKMWGKYRLSKRYGLSYKYSGMELSEILGDMANEIKHTGNSKF